MPKIYKPPPQKTTGAALVVVLIIKANRFHKIVRRKSQKEEPPLQIKAVGLNVIRVADGALLRLRGQFQFQCFRNFIGDFFLKREDV